jgi:hypothetical protein
MGLPLYMVKYSTAVHFLASVMRSCACWRVEYPLLIKLPLFFGDIQPNTLFLFAATSYRLCQGGSRFESRIAHRLPKSITMLIFLFTTCGDLLSSPDVFCVLARSSYPHSTSSIELSSSPVELPHVFRLSYISTCPVELLLSPGYAISSPAELSSSPVELPPISRLSYISPSPDEISTCPVELLLPPG